ncbi:MAG TPA: maleylpyruvate isomerase N-terminal domain-containing protein [Longimicrobium sp.]|nr:maleylpyruvate isomerase N-terminal domain-containing protein [Longimicrobium sp.]
MMESMESADAGSRLEPLAPVHTAELFPRLLAELITLLRGLNEKDWERPTMAGAWRVRDVAAHLLDGDLRKLSGGRDAHRLPADGPLSTFDDIVRLIDRQNASGVAYAQRLSPRVMTDLLEVTGRWVADFVAGLPPEGEAPHSVAWAGEERSQNWMDTGREYTERWHHQMQIRYAVDAPYLLGYDWLHPLLHLSVRAFPRAYAGVDAPAGTTVTFHVQDHDSFSIVRGAREWQVFHGFAHDAATLVRVSAHAAWRLLYNALPPGAARAHLEITGNAALAEPLLRARSVMVQDPITP